AVDLGFQPQNVVSMTVDLPDAKYRTAAEMQAFHTRVLERLSALPSVQVAGAVNWRPLGRGLIRGDFALADGRKLPRHYSVDKPAVSAGYFRAMGIHLLQGREFESEDRAGAPLVAVISQSVARELWPNGDALGQRLTLEEEPKPADWITIVGVVDDVRQQSPSEPRHAALYQAY